MPSVAARDYRCSWEIPYDFTPRIHAYPGVTSVVRAYMDSKPTPTSTAAAETTLPQRQQQKRNTIRHYRLRPLSAATAQVTVSQSLVKDSEGAAGVERAAISTGATRTRQQQQQQPSRPSAPHPSRRRPLHRGTTSNALSDTSYAHPTPRAETSVEGPVTPTPLAAAAVKSTARDTEEEKGEEEECTHVSARTATLSSAFQRRTFTPVAPSHNSHSGVVSVGRAAQPRPPPRVHDGYRSRTRLRYTLPPAYAAQLRQFEQQPVPTVTVQDRYASPPSLRELRCRARRVRLATREGFVDELHRCAAAQGNVGDVLPRSLLDSYVDAGDGRTFDLASHNFNAVLPDVYARSVAERAACLQATEQRMWGRMVLRVAPLSVAQREVHDAGGVAVMDSGHVSAPIFLSADPTEMCVDVEASSGGNAEDDDEEEAAAMAVVVLPFAEEVPPTVEAMRLVESRRCWPKGREWDRQAAIRCAVGATAQEAIVDLGIDPRYRQPGDFLLQRTRPR